MASDHPTGVRAGVKQVDKVGQRIYRRWGCPVGPPGGHERERLVEVCDQVVGA